MKNNTKIKTKLHEFGNAIGLDENDIKHSIRMKKTIVYMFVIASILTLIGLFSSRLVTVGMWYGGVSIRDIQTIFGRLFF
jgi:hypothetical protein